MWGQSNEQREDVCSLWGNHPDQARLLESLDTDRHQVSALHDARLQGARRTGTERQVYNAPGTQE